MTNSEYAILHMLFALLPTLAHADITGKVVKIIDGDTLTVLDSEHVQHKVRLAGIDAPEKKQAFGHKSKEALSDCAFSKIAYVEGIKIDRYRRLVGKVVVDGTDCNLRQVKLGLAWHYKKYEGEQSVGDRASYSEAERAASDQSVAIWSDIARLPPWDFRDRTRLTPASLKN